jgi:membrane-bound lytic murein transglycosylase A
MSVNAIVESLRPAWQGPRPGLRLGALAAAAALALTACVAPPTLPPEAVSLRPASYDDLPGWRQDDAGKAWEAFLRSCQVIGRKPEWSAVCADAAKLPEPDAAAVRGFIESRLRPYRLLGGDGTEEGLITGYYEPLLRGSRAPSDRYAFPLYGLPQDLLVLDLGSVYPELKKMRLRGRLEGRRVVPYYSRAEIDNGQAPLGGNEILWVDDALDAFFLQVQGSGRVRLDSGEIVRVGYADQNGHPYTSIGRVLVERGELTVEEASMQGIRGWAARNPDRARELLEQNASYVFFREVPGEAPGPIGSLGVPLTAGRSLAVDPKAVPKGVPVYLATTMPGGAEPLQRLMLAQDTGGAIKGPVRADFFWGFGPEAGEQAGRMREKGRLWVLLPKDAPPDAAAR